MLNKLTFFSQNGQVWKKLSFWVKIVDILWICLDFNKSFFLSQLEINHLIDEPTAKTNTEIEHLGRRNKLQRLLRYQLRSDQWLLKIQTAKVEVKKNYYIEFERRKLFWIFKGNCQCKKTAIIEDCMYILLAWWSIRQVQNNWWSNRSNVHKCRLRESHKSKKSQ